MFPSYVEKHVVIVFLLLILRGAMMCFFINVPFSVHIDIQSLGGQRDGQVTTAPCSLKFLTPSFSQDLDDDKSTMVLYAFKDSSDGFSKHSSDDRGAFTVNFATGDVEYICSVNDFISLHGLAMLFAWIVVAPVGIFYARYLTPTRAQWNLTRQKKK